MIIEKWFFLALNTVPKDYGKTLEKQIPSGLTGLSSRRVKGSKASQAFLIYTYIFFFFSDFAIQKSNTAVNEDDDAAFVVLPPQFSLVPFVNQNYSREEFKERSTDSATTTTGKAAAAGAATSSTVSIHLQQSSMSRG